MNSASSSSNNLMMAWSSFLKNTLMQKSHRAMAGEDEEQDEFDHKAKLVLVADKSLRDLLPAVIQSL